MKNNFKKLISLLKQSYFNIKSYFITKDKNIWVFGAIRGEKYMDNAKYLFEYVNKNSDIQAIWLTKNQKVIEQVSKKKYKIFDMDSKDGRYYALHAKVAIITHRGVGDKSDLPFYCFSKETKIIQLWHGIALKKIGFDDNIDACIQNESELLYKLKQKIKDIFFPYTQYVNSPTLLLALSNESKDTFSKAFRVKKEDIEITGYPRNDMLLTNNQTIDKRILNIIYMPTFRNKTDFDFDLRKLDLFLVEKSLKFYIKIHPFDKLSISMIKKISLSKNIFTLEHDDIYQELMNFDILITDYSSIYFDYLLLDRPIIFTPFDKDSYLKDEREFYYDYDAVAPGPQAQNWDEVIVCINDFIQNPNLFSKERKHIKDKFHQYQDDNSSKRVMENILKII